MSKKEASLISTTLNAKENVSTYKEAFASLDQFTMSSNGYKNFIFGSIARMAKDYCDLNSLENFMHFIMLMREAAKKLRVVARLGLIIEDINVKYIFETLNNDGISDIEPSVKFLTFDISESADWKDK